MRLGTAKAIMCLGMLLGTVISSFGESDHSIEYLLTNKGFLNDEASAEILDLSGRLTAVERFQLYERYRIRPGFLLGIPPTQFAFFPKYEDNTLKITMLTAGLVSTVSFVAAMASYDGDPRKPPRQEPVATGLILGGTLLGVVSGLYFLGLPIWNPKAYNENMVNQELRDVLTIKAAS